jgi:hypothetical protein
MVSIMRLCRKILWSGTGYRLQYTAVQRFPSWIPKATDTHSEYVILIAFPLQQWMHERPSMLRYSALPALLTWYKNLPKLFNSVI